MQDGYKSSPLSVGTRTAENHKRIPSKLIQYTDQVTILERRKREREREREREIVPVRKILLLTLYLLGMNM